MNRKKIFIGAAVAIFAIAACSSAAVKTEEAPVAESTPPVATVGPEFPSFAMKDAAGNAINLQSLKGKKVFVNLWASWCGPCRSEMPSIEKLYASVDKSKVAFVLLSFDENPDASLRFMQRSKLTLPVYFPAEQPPALFQPEGIPATYIFDEKGYLIKQNIGAEDYNTSAYRQLLQ